MSEFFSATLGNSLVGIVFLALAVALTSLIFYVWKFPFDHDRPGTKYTRRGNIGDRQLFSDPVTSCRCQKSSPS